MKKADILLTWCWLFFGPLHPNKWTSKFFVSLLPMVSKHRPEMTFRIWNCNTYITQYDAPCLRSTPIATTLFSLGWLWSFIHPPTRKCASVCEIMLENEVQMLKGYSHRQTKNSNTGLENRWNLYRHTCLMSIYVWYFQF